jgi:hypothetical protein
LDADRNGSGLGFRDLFRIVVSMLLILSCGMPPDAVARPTVRRVHLPLQSTTGVSDEGDPARAGGHLEAAHARAEAAMNVFDRRIASRARRAVLSICDGCASPRRSVEPSLERMEASARTEGEIVDDPAQAPLD